MTVNLSYSIKDTNILTGLLSDHSIIEIIVQSPNENNVRGKGFWKFNVSLLKDKYYVDKIKSCINEGNKKYNTT